MKHGGDEPFEHYTKAYWLVGFEISPFAAGIFADNQVQYLPLPSVNTQIRIKKMTVRSLLTQAGGAVYVARSVEIYFGIPPSNFYPLNMITPGAAGAQ